MPDEPFTRRLVRKECWIFEFLSDGRVAAGIWEYPENHMSWDAIALSDLPNELISLEDLARLGIGRCPRDEKPPERTTKHQNLIVNPICSHPGCEKGPTETGDTLYRDGSSFFCHEHLR